MALKKLPLDLQCLISSSLHINNFKGVVEELVYNSLDAKATSIAVRIDIAENKIQVVDNGCGITETDFYILGKKYSTSKCVDLNTLKSLPNTYGFRGQFLANLINIAQKVKITSRFEKGEDTWVKIFYKGKERDLAKTSTRPSVGTTVEVSGLFYNLHIQSRKLESLNELTEIKTLLKQLSLVHSNISISLRDDSKNEIIFKVHKNRDIYQTLGLLFSIDENDIVELKVEKKEYKVTAYFSKKDKDLAPYHWIYLNGKFLGNCKLHKIVNDNLNRTLKFTQTRKVKTTVDEKEDVSNNKNIPFYILLLLCPYYDYDRNDKSKHTNLEFKNWQEITNLLNKLITFYSGDEIQKKEMKPEIAANVKTQLKVSEGDTRNQVRKIVEKMLKSNPKKLGVSQMRNGIKGKLTKRKKKKKSLNISLSKVIPSQNKQIKQIFENGSQKDNLNHDILPTSSKYQIPIPNGNTEENDAMLKGIETVLSISDPKQHTTCKPKKERDYEIKSYKRNKTNVFDISVKKIHKEKNKGMKTKLKHNGSKILHENVAGTIISHNTENDQIIEHNLSSMSVIDKKQEVRLRNHQELVIYDYVPHPLNSTYYTGLFQSNLFDKKHITSRDLVKTILNTQTNYFPTNQYNSLHQKKSLPKQWEKSSNRKYIFAKNHYIAGDSTITNNAYESKSKIFKFEHQTNFSNTLIDTETHKDIPMNNVTTPNISQISYKEINVEHNRDDKINNNVNVRSKISNHQCDQILLGDNDTVKNNFNMKIRPRYMPKGMSQIFETTNIKGVCDYNFDEEYYQYNIYEDFTNEVQINTEIFKPRIQNAADETTKAIEKVNIRLHKENSSLTFDGQLLKKAQVLGQVDGKFIAAIVQSTTRTDNYLVLFDQHAVHERIRLEKNMLDYFNKQEWKSVKLDVFILKLSEEVILYLHNYKEKFSQLGLEWNFLSIDEISVYGIPEAILGKNLRPVEKIIIAVKNLILEEINSIKSQGGCISIHPKSIMDLVFSEACRYAIKFGDKLMINDCRELIQSLSDCRTPFQCAHGRPVMAVLMDMTRSEGFEYKVNISKIRLFTRAK
ncbi:DNA mismatch repair protein Mlh3 [Amyelois transitella]|uniref:DNA mismatch repair protein Mlh3 n=1 Tax=Amyelois transitella TaxID=680683 RepID=UPI00298F6549|nr:DNA mismatch repair protein Mlh3 [Amyelois transitella]